MRTSKRLLIALIAGITLGSLGVALFSQTQNQAPRSR